MSDLCPHGERPRDCRCHPQNAAWVDLGRREALRDLKAQLEKVTVVIQDDWMHESGYDTYEVDTAIDTLIEASR